MDNNCLFFDIAANFKQRNRYDRLITTLKTKYDLRPYKITKIYSSSAKKIYVDLKLKYEKEQHQINPTIWYENQRRLFIWFIICYEQCKKINLQDLTQQEWLIISKIFNKHPTFLQFQYRNLIKIKGRPTWTKQQDQLLIKAVNKQKIGKWNEISKEIFFVSEKKIFKSPKHCRERWFNHLDNSKSKTQWTKQEDLAMLNYILVHGKKWAKIARQLNNTRTQHMIKNRFNSLIGKTQKQLTQENIQEIKKYIQQLQNSQKDLIKNHHLPNNIEENNVKDLNNICFVSINNPFQNFNTFFAYGSINSPAIISPNAGWMFTPDSLIPESQAHLFQIMQNRFFKQMSEKESLAKNVPQFSQLSQEILKIKNNNNNSTLSKRNSIIQNIDQQQKE